MFAATHDAVCDIIFPESVFLDTTGVVEILLSTHPYLCI